MVKTNKVRYKWQYVGSNYVNLPYKNYDIIDTLEDRILESHDSPAIVKYRLNILNNSH